MDRSLVSTAGRAFARGWELRRGQCAAVFGGIWVMSVASCGGSVVPEQSGYAPLAALAKSGVAVVRVYCAPLPGLEPIATHPWFVVKEAGSREFERWEVWPEAAAPYQHVRLNMRGAEEDVGSEGVFVLAELSGSAAAGVVEFVRTQSPEYPCRDEYSILGVSSNTYAQWVLDQTGWGVELPRTAIGKSAELVCE